MITVANISRLREFKQNKPDRTTIIVGSKDLHENEKIQIARFLDRGNAALIGYENWIAQKGSHPVFFLAETNLIYVSALDKNGNYHGDVLADAVAAILATDTVNTFVTKDDLLMLGLPGKTKQERDRARSDLVRWFGSPMVKSTLSILCDESD